MRRRTERSAELLPKMRAAPPEDAGLARVGEEQAGQDLDGGRLAGAVGTQKAVDDPLGHREVDAVQHVVHPDGEVPPEGLL
jgi:hypothetical protein